MSKHKSSKKSFFRPVHLQAFLFFIAYTIVSKAVFLKSVTSGNMQIVFFVPYIFGVAAGIFFLYLFNHEDFFHFIKEIELEEGKKEKGYLKKYKHYGKILSTLIISAIGGPIFAALTIRFLLNKYWYKYIVLAVGNIASTAFAIFIAQGIIKIFV